MSEIIPHVGTWSRAVIEEVEDPNNPGEMITKVRFDKRKWSDEVALKVVEELARHGRTGTACRQAGISAQTFHKYLKRDPDFAQAVADAMETYKDKVIKHHQNLVFEGTEKETFDRNGNLVSREKIYPIPLIQMELRKVDASYRDKKEVDLNHRGGVMVAPAAVSVEDWEKKFGKPAIEGEFEDVTDDDRSGGDSGADRRESED